MASKLRRTGRLARKGTKGWIALQIAERALSTQRRGGTAKTKVVAASTAAGAAGAAGAYFLDPRDGTRRRHVARDKALKYLRRGGREATQRADYAAGQAVGAAHEARKKAGGEEPKEELTDQNLARKVETTIFRDGDVPKGQINVDAVGRTVTLRGQADSQERIDTLVRKANAIPEVEVVQSFLHLPGEPAPTRADAPAA